MTIRYISGFFLDDLKLTIGLDFFSKTTSYNEKKVKLQIWDFEGEERFRFLLHQYCKGANAAFILYNITTPHSLDNLSDWTQIIREHTGDIPIMLVGTNLHLKHMRAVTREEGIQAAKIPHLSGFIEVSSKTGQNVEKLFDILTEMLFERYRSYEEGDYIRSSTIKVSRPIIKSRSPSDVMRTNKKPPASRVSKPITYELDIANPIEEIRRDKLQQIKSFLKKLYEWLVKKIRVIFDNLRVFFNSL